MGNIVIFDDNLKFGSALKKVFSHALSEQDVEIHNELSEEKLSENSSILIIKAEFGGDFEKLKGLKFARRMRMNNQNFPVLVYSLLGRDDILRKNITVNQILLSKGFDFIKFPFSLKDLANKIESLYVIAREEIIKDARKWLFHPGRIAEIIGEEHHHLNNVFGSPLFLRGAYLAGDIDEGIYKAVEENIKDANKKAVNEDKVNEYYAYLENSIKENNTSVKTERLSDENKLTSIVGKKNILYIDDEHNLGWAKALEAIFGNTASIICKGEKPTAENGWDNVKNGIDTEIDRLKHAINGQNKIDLILLDLRLKGKNEENNRGPKDYSGVKLLERIRQIDPSVPVIIFTASNKALNQRITEECGADGFYTKPFPEAKINDNVLRNNYKEFRECVKECLERHYLRSIWEGITKFNGWYCSPGCTGWGKNAHELLKRAFFLLKIRKFKYYNSHLKKGREFVSDEVIILLRRIALEDNFSLHKKTINHNHFLNTMIYGWKINGENLGALRTICGLLVFHIGGAKAHSIETSLTNLDDALIVFWACLKLLGIDISYDYKFTDSISCNLQMRAFYKTHRDMIKCIRNPPISFKKRVTCKFKKDDNDNPTLFCGNCNGTYNSRSCGSTGNCNVIRPWFEVLNNSSFLRLSDGEELRLKYKVFLKLCELTGCQNEIPKGIKFLINKRLNDLDKC